MKKKTVRGKDRNKICEKCGKKLKKCECRQPMGRRAKLSILIALILVVTAIFIWGRGIYINHQTKVYEEKVTGLKMTLNQHLAKRKSFSTWWLKKAKFDNFDTRYEAIEKRTELISKLLHQYENANSISKKLLIVLGNTG